MRVGNKYELGRTLGEGNFGKVKFARNLDSGHPFAVKILEKQRIIDLKITDQIKREIGTLKLLKHPNVVRLHEVIASKTKIYMVLEYVNGGELFEKISSKGKLSEAVGRRLFQQLIDAVSYCHDKGIFHRDLKLENVLVDAVGNIKVSDFGLSALPQHLQIFKGETQIPKWLSPEAKHLIRRILDPNPSTRITMSEIKEHDWFKQDYTPAHPEEDDDDVHIDDEALSINEPPGAEKDLNSPSHRINAFELIGMSSCLDLSGFFEKEDVSERKIRFTSNYTHEELTERIKSTVLQMGFSVQKKNGKLKVTQEHKGGKNSANLSVAAEVFEISHMLNVVELRKSFGDGKVYRQLCEKLMHDHGVSRSQELLAAEF
uniref:non-specific serine/threonine protein kinase n=1 Tax=Daucus carota subsp. sativus TaxID=79200 RepID=A0A169WUJ1_DAUCS